MILQCFQFSFTWDIPALLGPWQTSEIQTCFKHLTLPLEAVCLLLWCLQQSRSGTGEQQSRIQPLPSSLQCRGLAVLCLRVLLTIQQCHPSNLTLNGCRVQKQPPCALLSSIFQANGIRTPCTRFCGRADELLGPLDTTLQSQPSSAVYSREVC